MANGDAFQDAVRLSRETPSLDIGCHLVLVQGRSLLTNRPFPDTPVHLLTLLARREIDIYAELRAQIETVLGAGIRLTHLDSHKHTHIVPGIFRQVIRLAHEFAIPYVRLPLDGTVPFAGVACALASRYYRRVAAGHTVRLTDHFIGFRLTGSLDEQTFAAAIASLSEGTTEFMCHPGYLGPELAGAWTRLKESRVRELEALTSPRIRELIAAQGIQLTHFDAP